MKPGRIVAGIFCSAFLFAGCNSLPPISDQLTLVPASGKTDATPGLDLTYLYGTNQGALNHVACDQAQNCWFSGVLGNFKANGSRINSLVIRSAGISRIAWAHTYQVNETYTLANGLVPTSDSGALLYGNTIISSFSGKHLEPVYEKLDASGDPQWGGALFIWGLTPGSAFSDAIQLQDGGYLLAGSGDLQKHFWYGVLLKINASGQMSWAEAIHSRNESTLITRIAQLPNGGILAVGINVRLRDIVLFRFSTSGKLLGSSILQIRGSEIPIGLVPVPDGLDVAVDQKMPSGEEVAIVLNFDKNGKLRDASRYHYIDGFSPNSIVALTSRKICLYGTTTAEDKPQSLAIALNAKQLPVSALIMKGGSALNSAALYKPGTIIFAGNRELGADEKTTPLLTRWTPSVKNDSAVLSNIRRDVPNIRVYTKAKATASPWDKPKWKLLKLNALPFRSIYGSSTPGPKDP